MTQDDRDVLEVLKAELDFVEKGGYGRSVRTPWLPTSTFQDSLTCLNFGDPERTHPCEECLLMQFVPEAKRSTDIPCHHIPLDAAGDTVDGIDSRKPEDDLEDRIKEWLRTTIKRLESERAQKPPK